MKLLTIIIVWTIILCVVAYFNAKFWQIWPDTESNEGEQAKPIFPPYKVPLSHEISYWASLLTLLAAIGAVVWMVCNAIL